MNKTDANSRIKYMHDDFSNLFICGCVKKAYSVCSTISTPIHHSEKEDNTI